MEVKICEKNGTRYVECLKEKTLVKDTSDALDLVGICGENRSSRLMLHVENLTPEFFELKTGVAGDILQKFVNYYLKVAAVIPLVHIKEGRFKEMVLETNCSKEFRVFQSREEAELWLTKG